MIYQSVLRLDVHRGGITYKNPRQNTPINIYFCRLGSCKLLITGNGRLNVTKSVTKLTDAMKYQMASWLTHVPSRLESQKEATGLQTSGSRMDSVKAQAPSKRRPTRVMRCMAVMVKMRRYCSMMDILTTHVATLYTMMDA